MPYRPGTAHADTFRATLALSFLQMTDTVTPLALFPRETFVGEPLVLSMGRHYIVENVVLVSAAIVVGPTVRSGRLQSGVTGEYPRLPRDPRGRNRVAA